MALEPQGGVLVDCGRGAETEPTDLLCPVPMVSVSGSTLSDVRVIQGEMGEAMVWVLAAVPVAAVCVWTWKTRYQRNDKQRL